MEREYIMSIVNCPNGHTYNDEEFESCPVCEEEGRQELRARVEKEIQALESTTNTVKRIDRVRKIIVVVFLLLIVGGFFIPDLDHKFMGKQPYLEYERYSKDTAAIGKLVEVRMNGLAPLFLETNDISMQNRGSRVDFTKYYCIGNDENGDGFITIFSTSEFDQYSNALNNGETVSLYGNVINMDDNLKGVLNGNSIVTPMVDDNGTQKIDIRALYENTHNDNLNSIAPNKDAIIDFCGEYQLNLYPHKEKVPFTVFKTISYVLFALAAAMIITDIALLSKRKKTVWEMKTSAEFIEKYGK